MQPGCDQAGFDMIGWASLAKVKISVAVVLMPKLAPGLFVFCFEIGDRVLLCGSGWFYTPGLESVDLPAEHRSWVGSNCGSVLPRVGPEVLPVPGIWAHWFQLSAVRTSTGECLDLRSKTQAQIRLIHQDASHRQVCGWLASLPSSDYHCFF